MHYRGYTRRTLLAAGLAVSGVAVLHSGTPAQGAPRATITSYGTISNFDVFNDTGQETHGFEIELDGVSASQITYEFGAPYERYGNPTLVTFSGGVDVIYASPYDKVAKKFTAATPRAPTPIQGTAGHACWTGGSANYTTAGCEHFGLGLTANPTNIVYTWLVADPKHAGHLVKFGTNVPIPAPQWSATPPAPGNPNRKPVLAARVVAPEPDLGQQLGDAVWVKVFITESASPSDLNHLVTGDRQVPSASTQTETDWLLIQNGAGGGLATELDSSKQLGSRSLSVVRRYQFFAYTGPYVAENHEATPINDSQPSAGELGGLIGNQMAGLNLAVSGKVPGDRIAPKASFVTHPPSTTRIHTATFSFHATDNVSKGFSWFCSLDKKIPSRCANPLTLRSVPLGRHMLSVYAIDRAGNPSRPVSFTWIITR